MTTRTEQIFGYPFRGNSARKATIKTAFQPVFFTFVGFCILAFQAGSFGQEVSTAVPGEEAQMTQTQVEERLKSVQDELAALPQNIEGEGPEAQYQNALQKLADSLQSYNAALTSLNDTEAQLGAIDERSKKAQSTIDELNKTVEGETTNAPDTPTKEGLEEVRQEAKQYQETVQDLQRQVVDVRQRQESLSTRLSEAGDTLTEAQKKLDRFATEDGKTSDADKNLFSVNMECARVDSYLAQTTVKSIEVQGKLDTKLEPVLEQEIEIAEKKAARIEGKITLYEDALKDQMLQEQKQLNRELAEKEKTAATAATPAESFLANAETELATSRKNNAEVQTSLIEIGKDAGEQEKRLNAEKAELESLRALLLTPDSEEMAKERIRQTMDILTLRKKTLSNLRKKDPALNTAWYRSRRFEIENLQFEFSEKREQAVSGLAETLPEQGRAAFVTKAQEVLSQWRTALREEKASLTEAISLSQKMEDLIWGRVNTLNETQRFVRSRALWIRDAQPIHQVFLARGQQELSTISQVLARTVTASTPAFFLTFILQPATILAVILVVIIFPVVLWFLKHKVKRVLRVETTTVPLRGMELLKNNVRNDVLTFLIALLIPAWFFATAYAVSLLDLPYNLKTPLFTFCLHGAFIMLAWSLIRLFLGEKKLANEERELYRNGRRALRRALRLVLFAYAACLLPATVIAGPPTELDVLPRILQLIFIAIATLVSFWAMRPRSSLTAYAVLRLDSASGRRIWAVTAVLLPALLAGAFVLNTAGFRYASSVISANVALSLMVLAGLALTYLGALKLALLFSSTQPLAGEILSPIRTIHQFSVLKRLIGTILLFATILLLSLVWGVDEQALGTLEEIHLYSLHGSGDQLEFVTAADIFWFAVYLAVMAWLLRYLPGIYEFAIFPRLKIDDGAKYAILTISRYGIFVIGVVLALSQIHLDLGRLGWLIAAIGVGLGFGLQEIISNFFSGIILLIESPIRINDIVTIGDTTGTVRRINIRATTIRNFDYQEVVLPNKDLITRAVTNWTRGDTVNRLVIGIGVAYGSDVNLISQTLYDIATDDPDVLEDPAPLVTFENHGDSALEFVLRVFLPSPSLRLSALDRLNKKINETFTRLNIEIPFPQRDIHIRSHCAAPEVVEPE